MPSKKNSRLRITLIGAVVLASLVASAAFRGHAYKARSSWSAGNNGGYPPFTLTSSRTVINANGQTHLRSEVQRFQRVDGVYKLVQTLYPPNGTPARAQTYFGFIGLGVFRLDEPGRRLVFTGPLIDESPADIEQTLRANPLFVREESVAGIRTIVWHRAGEGPGDFVEEYRALPLGGLLIKTVMVSGPEREIFEPAAIQMGQPPASLFTELLSYPSDYSFYEGRVQQAEKHNNHEAASMRQLLERMRQFRP